MYEAASKAMKDQTLGTPDGTQFDECLSLPASAKATAADEPVLNGTAGHNQTL